MYQCKKIFPDKLHVTVYQLLLILKTYKINNVEKIQCFSVYCALSKNINYTYNK